MAKSIIAQANLPISFRGDVILTTAYILNHVPSKSIPSMAWQKPNLQSLHPWGSTGFVNSTSHKYGNLDPSAYKLIFIRYCDHSKGYVMFGEHRDKGMTEIESGDVDFLEEDFPSLSEVKGNLELYEL
ncbi:UNVERIFIED_CONTAM: hypothetical protein Scaly_2908500 [Sesamum calycinum]|uniref:Retroviral polymerase SH3-like domain-containing protein n=1 Tax=Sesamum calycinum TaxID=2727403 RepID=A0AAW2L515_9LAMI